MVLLVQQLLGNAVIMIVEDMTLVTALLQEVLQEALHHGPEIVDVVVKAVEILTMVVRMATMLLPRHLLLLLGNNKLQPTLRLQQRLVDMVVTVLLATTPLIHREEWVLHQGFLARVSLLSCNNLLVLRVAHHRHLLQARFLHHPQVPPPRHLPHLISLLHLPQETKQVDFFQRTFKSIDNSRCI